MFHRVRNFVLLLVVVGVALSSTAQTVSKRVRRPKPAAGRLSQPAPAAPAEPASPLPPRPDQLPPNAPQVTYQNGQLSITADNSTLSSILAAVRTRTGAQIDFPTDTNDRVAVRLGPGNPRDVLAALLQGSRFDYILLGSETDPNVLSHVILTPRHNAPGLAAASMANAATPGTSATPQPGAGARPGLRPTPMPPEQNEEEEAEEEPAPAPQPAAPAPQAGPPDQTSQQQPAATPPGSSEASQPGQAGQPGTPGQVKTPEQFLQELQRLQQERNRPQPQGRSPQPPPPQ